MRNVCWPFQNLEALRALSNLILFNFHFICAFLSGVCLPNHIPRVIVKDSNLLDGDGVNSKNLTDPFFSD